MLAVAVFAVLFASVLALRNWRHGFALCVVTALAQDPLRKLVPGQPVYFVVLVGVVFAAACLGAILGRVRLSPRAIAGWNRHLGLPFALFLGLALLQSLRTLVAYSSPAISAIGLLSYFAPVPAIALAYRFSISRGEAGVLKWMRFYAIAAALVLVSVYLEFFGMASPLLGEVGGGIEIYALDIAYKGNAGLFRATEIAAWHAAAVGCFGFMLLQRKGMTLPRWFFALGLLAFVLVVGVLTGRRKMIVELAIFLGAFYALRAWYLQRDMRIAVIAVALTLFTYMGAYVLLPSEEPGGLRPSTDARFGKYSERASTVFEDVPRRIMDLGVKPVSWAIEQHGWLGAGVGAGSQGTRHFGAEASGAAEGGLGKVTVELGLPGLLLAFWLAFAAIRYVGAILRIMAAKAPRSANFAFGMVAFLLANVAAFSVATQAYADIFILLSLGWVFGFLLSLPVLVEEPPPEPRAVRPRTSSRGPALARLT